MTMRSAIQVYVVPAAVFQSVIFGGAYGTGREIVEFISRFGGVDGLWALLTIGLTFGLCLALTFELARATNSYDYRSFLRQLIGRWWVAYEVLFIALLLLVLAVNLSAASEILLDGWRIPKALALLFLLSCVILLIFLGRGVIQLSMVFWSASLMLVLVVYCIASYLTMGEQIGSNMVAQGNAGSASLSGFRYALYNLGGIPVLLYAARGIQHRQQALASGAIAGCFGALPALFFHCSFMADYPAIIDATLPTWHMMQLLPVPGLLAVYGLVLIAMIVHTIVGLLHGFNERLTTWLVEARGKAPNRWVNAGASGALLLLSLALSNLGIIALIASGYGNLAWAFLLVFVLPLVYVSARRALLPVRA